MARAANRSSYFFGQGSRTAGVRYGTSWTQQRKLSATDSSRVSYFGHRVALYGDYAVVSDHYAGDFGYQKGAAWIFIRSGSSWT